MTEHDEWTNLVPEPRPLGAGETFNVFLSYRSANRSWVINLYDVLKRYGHRVFLDQVQLVGGDDLITCLESALTKSQAGVLVWSSHARDSDWVRREYHAMERMAGNARFRFVPIRVDDSTLPIFTGNRIFLDFSTYPDGPNGGELLRLLHAVVGEPLTEDAARFADRLDVASKSSANQVAAAVRLDRPLRIQELFDKGGLPWMISAALGCKAAEGLAKLGHNDDALAMLDELTVRFPRALRPKQLTANVLTRRARNGGSETDIEKAQDILGELYEAGEHDPETLGMLGATWMERYERSKRREHLQNSRQCYLEAFRGAKDDYYTGINAAAKSVLLGEREDIELALHLADDVHAIAGTEPRPGDYWRNATIGEAFLIKRSYAEAGRVYQAAVDSALTEAGSHGSTWKQASRLMEKLQPTAEQRAVVRKAFAHLPDA